MGEGVRARGLGSEGEGVETANNGVGAGRMDTPLPPILSKKMGCEFLFPSSKLVKGP